jgi:hypothetical protein
MSDARRREKQDLHAFQDGELPPAALGRGPPRRTGCGRRESWMHCGAPALLREQAAALPGPDLWESVRAQLPTAARPAPLDADDAVPAVTPWLPTWLGAAIAVASVAGVMASGVLSGDAAPVGSLRWLDSKGKPVMVLQDDRDATIIWVLQKPEQISAGARDAVA